MSSLIGRPGGPSYQMRLEVGGVMEKLGGMISVQHLAGDEWEVSVAGPSTTRHRVRVTQVDLDRFAQGRPAEALLEESFRFLLERESNTSILSRFDLPVIGDYFPEYEREIRGRLGGGA